MDMNKYKLKRGSHVEGGVTYSAPQIVESPHNLSAMFPDKFENLGPVVSKHSPFEEEEEEEDKGKETETETEGEEAGEEAGEEEETEEDDDDFPKTTPRGNGTKSSGGRKKRNRN